MLLPSPQTTPRRWTAPCSYSKCLETNMKLQLTRKSWQEACMCIVHVGRPILVPAPRLPPIARHENPLAKMAGMSARVSVHDGVCLSVCGCVCMLVQGHKRGIHQNKIYTHENLKKFYAMQSCVMFSLESWGGSHKRGSFLDLRFPGTIGLTYGFLSYSCEGGGGGRT